MPTPQDALGRRRIASIANAAVRCVRHVLRFCVTLRHAFPETAAMAETSPQPYARFGGLLYLVIIVAGLIGELAVRGTLVVSGDPVATAVAGRDRRRSVDARLRRLRDVGDLRLAAARQPAAGAARAAVEPDPDGRAGGQQ